MPKYEQIIYNRILAHQHCTQELGWNKPGDEDFTTTVSAVQIINYDDGVNLSIECMKCNEPIVDFNREGN